MKKRTIQLQTLTSRIFHRVGEGELDGVAILTSYLQNVHKMEQAAIDSILKHGKIVKDGEASTDTATAASILATLTELDKARIVKVKTDTEKESYQKGYTKAKGEVLTDHEKEIKEKYGVESSLKGQELYDFILAEKLKSGGIDEEGIKKSATYQQAEARWKKELETAKKAGDDKVKELETTYKKEGTFTKVGNSAIDILTALNPVLPKNAVVAETYKRDFLNELKGFDYEVHDDGSIVVMSKEGKVLEDGHGNTLSYEDHVKKIAGGRFEFAVNNEGENAGDKNDPKGKAAKAYPAGINKPKNMDELALLTSADSKLSIEDRRVVMDEYRARTAAK